VFGLWIQGRANVMGTAFAGSGVRVLNLVLGFPQVWNYSEEVSRE
jgi:hypothetical protein